MDWKSPYVIYRFMENQPQADGSKGEAQIVFVPYTLQKAKYWLQYIAEPFDVLCITPAHPKHSKKSDQPEYWAHKEKGGKPAYSAAEWERIWTKLGWNNQLGQAKHETASEENH